MDSTNIYIVTDICPGGELLGVVEQHAKDKRPLEERWVAKVFMQIIEGIGYCHSKGVMHKDIKLENIMLRTPAEPIEDVKAVIIDVGLAELFGAQHKKASRSTQVAGSLCTMSPEMVRRAPFSYKCDIYSLGCLLFAIFNPTPEWLPDGKGGQILYTYPYMPRPTAMDPSGIQSLIGDMR